MLSLWAVTAALAADLDQAGLTARVAALAPLVEEAAGRSFTHLPPVQLAEPDTLAQVVFTEQLHLMGRRRGLSRTQAEARAIRTAVSMYHASFGKFAFLEDILFVDPAGIRAALNRDDQAQFDDVLDLVLAHELTHALQDQQLDLGRLAGDRHGDAGVAVMCAVEGHAAWVQARVAQALDRPEAAALMGALLGYDASDPGASDSPTRFHDSYVYGQGAAFTAAIAASRGVPGTWSVLAAPPARTAMIVHPERYAPTAPLPAPRVRRTARAVRRALAPAGWSHVEQAVGDYALRQSLMSAGVGPDLADDLVLGWTARSTADDHTGVDVQLLTFRDPTHAQRYAATMWASAQASAAESATVPLVSAEVRPLEVEGADQASLERFHLSLPGLPEQRVASALAIRGPHAVQLILVNLRADDDALRAGLARVLATLE